jgi:hypothetical protein
MSVAHSNPEIVILDEVLAVGDAVFQKKCFDRMEEIINEGHAAILVSHGVRRMSQVCMWLSHGRVQLFGPTHEVVAQFGKQTTHDVVSELEKKTAHAQELSQPEPIARLEQWSVESKLATDAHTIDSGGARLHDRRRRRWILRMSQSLTCDFGAPLNLVGTLSGFFVAKVWRPAAGGVISNCRQMLLFGPENSRERIRIVEGDEPPGMLYCKGKRAIKTLMVSHAKTPLFFAPIVCAFCVTTL